MREVITSHTISTTCETLDYDHLDYVYYCKKLSSASCLNIYSNPDKFGQDWLNSAKEVALGKNSDPR